MGSSFWFAHVYPSCKEHILPCTSPGQTVELVLVVRVPVSQPEGMRAEVAQPLLVCFKGWASLGSIGELALVVMMRESWQSDHTSCYPDPEGLWADLPQHPPYLCEARACEGARPTDPTHQDLHDIRQQQNLLDESQWGPSIKEVAEARGLH